MSEKEYDLLVFGATSVTGKLGATTPVGRA